jgi:hypothetical protein
MQDDLVKQGFTFVRGSKLTYVERDSDKIRIMMTQKQGLTFWSGVPLNKAEHPKVESINDNQTEQFDGFVAAATSTTKLIDLMNDATLTTNKFRRTLVQKRAAELGCYISDEPKGDKFLQLHQKIGHCSIERCVDYINASSTTSLEKSKRSTERLPKNSAIHVTWQKSRRQCDSKRSRAQSQRILGILVLPTFLARNPQLHEQPQDTSMS